MSYCNRPTSSFHGSLFPNTDNFFSKLCHVLLLCCALEHQTNAVVKTNV